MPGTSQKYLGMIPNEFRRDLKTTIFIKKLTSLRGAVNVHSWPGLGWSVAGLFWSVSLLTEAGLNRFGLALTHSDDIFDLPCPKPGHQEEHMNIH